MNGWICGVESGWLDGGSGMMVCDGGCAIGWLVRVSARRNAQLELCGIGLGVVVYGI